MEFNSVENNCRFIQMCTLWVNFNRWENESVVERVFWTFKWKKLSTAVENLILKISGNAVKPRTTHSLKLIIWGLDFPFFILLPVQFVDNLLVIDSNTLELAKFKSFFYFSLFEKFSTEHSFSTPKLLIDL